MKVVIPCYNEEARFPTDAFVAYLRDHHHTRFLLVNDGSRDGTLGVLHRLAARFPERIAVLDLQPNQGKAEAVRRGLLACAEGEGELIGFWDADLATPLETIDEFADLLRERRDIDWVIGARVKLLGRHVERHASRHYLGRLFATCASLTLGIAIYDTQCGAKLFRTSPDLLDSLRRPFASRWVFDVELIGRYLRRLAARGVETPENRIYEFPLRVWVDVQGSKVGPLDFLKAMVEMAGIWVRLRREPEPPPAPPAPHTP